MNVIVSNKQKAKLDNINIDAIKELNGFFNVSDLINNFKNYFFSKMIIDATSIVEFANPEVLKKLVEGIGAEKLIILLPEKPVAPKTFLELLVSLGIYNFSSNVNDIIKYLNKPNSLDDINFVLNDYFDYNISDKKDTEYSNVEDKVNNTNEENRLELNANYSFNDYLEEDNGNNVINNHIEDNNIELDNKVQFSNDNDNKVYKFNDKYILGIKNVTLHAGTTSLIYMLKQTLEYKFNKKVLALEVNSRDFMYFKSNNMISVSNDELVNVIENSDSDIILIDLNDNNYEKICNDILYLVEPSIIKINKLVMNNRMYFATLKNKKVVLNKSLLSKSEIDRFSNEAEIQFFFNIPALNDRVLNSSILDLINKLEINRDTKY